VLDAALVVAAAVDAVAAVALAVDVEDDVDSSPGAGISS